MGPPFIVKAAGKRDEASPPLALLHHNRKPRERFPRRAGPAVGGANWTGTQFSAVIIPYRQAHRACAPQKRRTNRQSWFGYWCNRRSARRLPRRPRRRRGELGKGPILCGYYTTKHSRTPYLCRDLTHLSSIRSPGITMGRPGGQGAIICRLIRPCALLTGMRSPAAKSASRSGSARSGLGRASKSDVSPAFGSGGSASISD